LNEINALLEERQQQVEEQAEELLAQRDELQEVNNVKDKLFSIIAHDLRNPFGVIRGIIELLHLRFEKYPVEKRREMISSLYSSSNDMNSLLVNLLNWSRTQRGALNLECEEKDLIVIMQNNLKVVRSQADTKNIQLNLSAENQEIKCRVDENVINTVLRNLLSNAIKFTKEKGMVSLSCHKKGSFYTLKVEDNGVGISPENMSKLFGSSSFSTYGTNQEKGTGLGLQICKEFVKHHGGRIWVESELGKGTSFYFTVPA
jgi:two-component system sensor histidine kinase/response regulator